MLRLLSALAPRPAAGALLLLIPLVLAADPRDYPRGRVDLSPLDCVIEPQTTLELGSPVEGILEVISVDRGDTVQKGQILAKLESRVEYVEVAIARARAAMTGEIKARQANLEFARRLDSRTSALFDTKAISLQQKDQFETDARVARLLLLQAKETKKLAELELWRANEALQRRTIQSPISGVVVEVPMSLGELVDEQPIMTLAQIDPLRVELIVPANRYGSIQPGMRAEVTPEPPAEGVYQATVTVVDRIIDAASGTFRVRAELPNPDYALPAGLRCKVRFPGGVPASPEP